MIFRFSTYTPVKRGVSDNMLFQMLPTNIREELIKDERIPNGVWIELSKKDIIREIDKIFKIPKSRKITKYYHVEVTQEDIDQFGHFFLLAETIYYKKDFDATFNESECDNVDCPFGAFLSAPYIIKRAKLSKFDIGGMFHPMVNERYLMISERLKTIFENNNITGLEYEKCQFTDKMYMGKPIYFSKITGIGSTVADDIRVNRWCCKKHRIPAEFHSFNDSYPNDMLSKEDFQLIPTIHTTKGIYRYQTPALIITTRVLKILLDSKSIRFLNEGFFYKKSFRPCAPVSAIRQEE